MSYFSGASTVHLVNLIKNKNEEKGNKKLAQSSADQFECAADGYSIAFVIFGLFFAILTAISVVCLFRDVEDAVVAIFVFGVITLLSLFAAWATAHHRLIVEGNEATYVNVWGITKKFSFSDVTKCLTTEQSISLYIENKKVVTLSKDVYGLKFLQERCKKDGIEWGNKSHAGITKFTLVWHASRTLALILFWATVGIVVLMVVISISSGKNPLDQIVLLLELTLYIAGMFGCMFLGFMLYFALGLKEVKAIEKGLGLSFREEMAKRGAIGREYQDEEWFVETAPGKIEVLNRRFIKAWLGIKNNRSGRVTNYHIEFIDINGKKRSIGGHY